MVEPIGAKPLTATAGVTKVAAVAPAPAPEQRLPDAAASSARLSGTARQLSAAPPVDYERITRIRKAVAEGNFPILPSTIADRLLALRMDWVARDEA